MTKPLRSILTHLHRTNRMVYAAKVLMASITAIALVACGGAPPSTILRVPASELPGLGPSTLPRAPANYVVTTIDGSKHPIGGKIERVELDINKRAVPIELPFKARIQGEQLEVLTDQTRTYRVPDISYVSVQYSGSPPGSVSPGRRDAGVGLMALSIAPIGVGIYALVESNGQGGGLAKLGPVVGGGIIAVGAILLIVGASISSPSTPPPARPPKNSTFVRPRLHVSPTGASFAAEF
jgi:hypothetical protein